MRLSSTRLHPDCNDIIADYAGCINPCAIHTPVPDSINPAERVLRVLSECCTHARRMYAQAVHLIRSMLRELCEYKFKCAAHTQSVTVKGMHARLALRRTQWRLLEPDRERDERRTARMGACSYTRTCPPSANEFTVRLHVDVREPRIYYDAVTNATDIIVKMGIHHPVCAVCGCCRRSNQCRREKFSSRG